MMKKSTQLGLLSAIREIFRGKDVIEEYHPPSSMSQDGTRGYQLDAYLPSLELAFEYQGELHFQAVASYMYVFTHLIFSSSCFSYSQYQADAVCG
jgi:hypothetical protein